MPVPGGLSGSAAIALVQEYANEPTLPAPSTVLSFLNRGVEEVARELGGIRLWSPYYTVNQQTIVQLNADVLDVISANFSMGGAPTDRGALVYPMQALEQATFMDAAAGFPAVGFGPPQAYFVYQDAGNAPGTSIPPPALPVLSVVSGTSNGLPVYVALTYVNRTGETVSSGVFNGLATITPTTAQQAQVASPQTIANANVYNVYASNSPGGPFFIQNGAGNSVGTNFTLPSPLFTVGATPPGVTTATFPTGGSLSMQVYPSAMVGQVNIYYRARPQLWSSATSGTDFTNLDTSAQEAVVFYGVMRVLDYRGRGDEAAQIWQPRYNSLVASLKESIGRRAQPKSGQVRDVRDRSYPSAPWWLTS